MNLLEGGKGGRMGERGWGGDGEREGGGDREGVGERGTGRGGMTVTHIVIGMFNSNPMIPQYL